MAVTYPLCRQSEIEDPDSEISSPKGGRTDFLVA